MLDALCAFGRPKRWAVEQLNLFVNPGKRMAGWIAPGVSRRPLKLREAGFSGKTNEDDTQSWLGKSAVWRPNIAKLSCRYGFIPSGDPQAAASAQAKDDQIVMINMLTAGLSF
jgi:hypothetical protein